MKVSFNMTTASKPNPRNNHRWHNRVARERRYYTRHPELATCWLCAESIDMSLPPGHRNAFTLDHIVPLSKGGDLHGDAKPAHRSCNSSRGRVRDDGNDNVFGL